MRKHPISILVIGVILATAEAGTVRQRLDKDAAETDQKPALRHTCLITNNVQRLLEFYGRVLQISPKTTGSDYAEFATGGGVLAVFSAIAQEKYIPGSAKPAENKSAILEFEVADVDREYARLRGIVKDWVKTPATQPWGTRSIYFRDPDGNLVDFYAWVKVH